MVEVVVIGKVSVSADYLRSLKIDEAVAQLKHLKPEVVKALWRMANPRRLKKRSPES